MTVLVASLLGVMLLGTVFGVVLVRRSLTPKVRVAALEQPVGLVRVQGRVRTGAERCLVALARELALPRDSVGMQYGLLYLEPGAGTELTVRTHSVLDRGLIAPIVIVSKSGHSEVTYSISRLPRDEALRVAVLDFEVQLIAALRRIDPAASVRLSGTTLSDLDGLQRLQLAAEERAARR